MENFMSLLFKTNAFKICHEDNPFWYTSEKFTPYFVNTHFLYGSENQANELLNFINSQLKNEEKINIPKNIFKKVIAQYKSNTIYKNAVDSFVNYIKANINIDNIDYISGGEKRDWYFSLIIANILEKPHITIFKDLSTVESSYDFEYNSVVTSLKDKNILHISDLLSQSSSYVNSWIPAIKNLGSKIKWSCVVVDRMQGGKEVLQDKDIKPFSLLQIDKNLFKKALDLGIINNAELKMLNNFTNNSN